MKANETEPLRTIRLYGTLGARYGRVHHLVVHSVAEAFRALCVLLPGFERELMTSRDRGLSYAVFLDRDPVTEAALGMPCGDRAIRVAPVMRGAKSRGLTQVIIGVVIIAAAVASAGWSIPATGTLAGAAFSVGVSLALGGVVQMLSPQQKGLGTKDAPDNGASYAFNGAVNTSAQGNPVPVLYGRLLVGSATISAAILAEDQA